MGRGKNRDQLCDCGLDLVFRQGFRATGVQEIADAAGVPKGSFYNYFKSKDDFAVQMINCYMDHSCQHLTDVLKDGPGTPLERLRALFQGWTRMFRSGEGASGCFTANMAQEVANQNPTIRRALEEAFDRAQTHFTQCLEEAQKVGEIGPDEDPRKLAAFIDNSWQGALIRAKAMASTAPLEEFQEIIFKKLLR